MEAEGRDASGGIHRVAQGERVVSVDVLRGFDMFWLAGGTGLGLAIGRLCRPSVRDVILPQLDHAKWVGFTFYDLIFPLFVFMVGMSVTFSLGRLIERGGRRIAYWRIFRRTLLMFLLGVIYNGGMTSPLGDVRWLGVLQRLALCYLFTGLLFCHLRTRGLIVVGCVLLVGYAILLASIPAPGQDRVSWEPTQTWPAYVDGRFLPGHKHEGTWDANGLLSTLPAVASCLLGVLASKVLQTPALSDKGKVVSFLMGGAGMVALGWIVHPYCPVIKKLWTSSYVLVAGGYSVILLGVFYLIVDVLRIRWWTAPFLWIGSNAITIYMARNLMDFNALAERFVGGSLKASVSPDVAYLLKTAVSLGLSLCVVRFLYRRKIFLRV